MVPTVDIPIPSFPDPREWFINGWNALLDYVFGSPSDAMKEMTRTVAEAQHADLNSPNIEWFKTIYNDVAGLAVVLALLGVVVYVFTTFGQPRYVRNWWEFVVNVGKLLGVIAFTPMAVGVAIYIVKLIVKALLKLGDVIISADSWSSSLTQAYSYTDIIGGGLVRLTTQLGGMSIKLAITPQQMLEYTLMVFSVLAYIWTKTIDQDSRLNRLTWTLLLTVLSAQPVMVLVLVLGGAFISRQDAPSAVKAIEVMFLTLACLAILLGLFFGMKHQVTKVIRSKLDVEGRVKVEGDVNADDIEIDLAEQRASREEGHATVSSDGPLEGEVIFHPAQGPDGSGGSTGQSPGSESVTVEGEVIHSTTYGGEPSTTSSPVGALGGSSSTSAYDPGPPDSDRPDSSGAGDIREAFDNTKVYAGTAAMVTTATDHPEVTNTIAVTERPYDFFTDKD